MVQTKVLCTVIGCIGICLFLLAAVEAAPTISRHYNQYYNDLDDATPEEVLMELIARFGQTIMRARDDLENSKRTVMDFGMARGYSGMQEAKHRMGIAAANFPGGPGRRRRSLTDQSLNF